MEGNDSSLPLGVQAGKREGRARAPRHHRAVMEAVGRRSPQSRRTGSGARRWRRGAVPCGGLTEQARVPAPAATARASPSLPRAAGHWGRGAPLPDWRGSASCGPLRGRGPPVTEWLISAPSLMGRWFLWWGRGTLVLPSPSPGGEGPRTPRPSSLAALTHTARSWAPAVCVLSWGSLCGRPLFFGTGQ